MVRSLVSGSIMLPGILSQLLAQSARGEEEVNPLAPRAPHFPGTAKRVILLYHDRRGFASGHPLIRRRN